MKTTDKINRKRAASRLKYVDLTKEDSRPDSANWSKGKQGSEQGTDNKNSSAFLLVVLTSTLFLLADHDNAAVAVWK